MNDRDDSPDARRIAARRYLSTVPLVEDWGEQLATHLAGAIPRERITELLEPHREPIEAAHITLLTKHLTPVEIDALTALQASPVGRSIMRKLGALEADLITALSPLLRGVIEAELHARGVAR